MVFVICTTINERLAARDVQPMIGSSVPPLQPFLLLSLPTMLNPNLLLGESVSVRVNFKLVINLERLVSIGVTFAAFS